MTNEGSSTKNNYVLVARMAILQFVVRIVPDKQYIIAEHWPKEPENARRTDGQDTSSRIWDHDIEDFVTDGMQACMARLLHDINLQ
jgi:hypothetical protein